MKKKKWPIYIWFLDDDLVKSASFLTEKTLIRSIDGCIGAIVSTYLYFIGIRSKKFYDYYFSKENISSTMSRFFASWPSDRPPKFNAYSRKESKWCRMCLENFEYVEQYLQILLDEYIYRHRNAHHLSNFVGWAAEVKHKTGIPSANISNAVLPWKVIDPKFRSINIIDGYRLQFMKSFESDDPFLEYKNVPRDIPKFVVDYFGLEKTFER